METTKGVQYVLVGFQLLVLGWFAVSAFVHVANGSAFDATAISPDWFNPFAVDSFSSFAAGVSLSIFIYWGWDVTLTMNEETRNPEKTPGRAATVTVVVIMAIYMLVALATLSFAGVGETGLGAGNPENQSSIFAVLAGTGDGSVRHPDVAGHPQQLGRVPAVHVCLTGPHATGDGALQGAANEIRQGQSGVQIAELRHDCSSCCRGRRSTSSPGPRRRTPSGTPSRRWA